MPFSVTLEPSQICFDVADGNTILEGALVSNKTIAYSCKDGSCGTCKCKLIDGDVCGLDNHKGLTQKEKKSGYILTCQAKPKSNLLIQLDYLKELDGIVELTLPCKVNSIEFPSKDIAVLKFRLPPNAQFKYLSGQYIDLIFKGDRRSYSIANLYTQTDEIELHVRNIPQGLFSELVFNQLKLGDLFRLNGPYGTFFVRESSKPIIFLAGGTGFAPVKAMIEDLILKKSKRLIYIYWGCQDEGHFYSKAPSLWQESHVNITYTPVLSGQSDTWQDRKGLVHEAVLNDFDKMSNFQVYACGSPLMVEAAKKEFLALGLPEMQFYSDAFTAFNK